MAMHSYWLSGVVFTGEQSSPLHGVKGVGCVAISVREVESEALREGELLFGIRCTEVHSTDTESMYFSSLRDIEVKSTYKRFNFQ